MDIGPVSRNSALPAAAPAIPADRAAENREVIQAVKAVNNAELFGDQNELAFQLDPKTHRMLIRVINRRTKEVVDQYPPEYILRLAEGQKP
jgi:uncharacterized FlaG/YvyC family protein